MAKLPEIDLTVDKIYSEYEKLNLALPRPHLGASIIGKPCERYLWYSFRWCIRKKLEGRVYRLFQRGQLEEDVFIKDLRAIGIEVWDKDENGKQFTCSFCYGHFGGSCDGIGRNFPEAPKAPHVLEFKTVGKKNFTKLVKDGVEKTFPEYFAQVQVYMEGFDIDRAFFLAVCKDNDELYQERIKRDRKAAEYYISRAQSIIDAKEAPVKISQDPAWWQCKFCDAYDICHGVEIPPANCRNCCFASPNGSGGWNCEKYETSLTKEEQYKGCGSHLYIPTLLGEPVNSDCETWTLIDIGSKRICNCAETGFPFADIPENSLCLPSSELEKMTLVELLKEV